MNCFLEPFLINFENGCLFIFLFILVFHVVATGDLVFALKGLKHTPKAHQSLDYCWSFAIELVGLATDCSPKTIKPVLAAEANC